MIGILAGLLSPEAITNATTLVKAEVPSVTGDEARCSTDLLLAVHFGPVPVLTPDTGKTKTGRLWTYKGGRRRAEFAPDSALEGEWIRTPVPATR